jgi:hypothetical protein
MTALEASKLIGKIGIFTTQEGFTIDVRINDVKQAYGRTRYLISPVNGTGKVWTETEPQIKQGPFGLKASR